jgi:hypothetical protein
VNDNNKSMSTSSVITRLELKSPMIQKEQSCLNFVNESLGIINEVPRT